MKVVLIELRILLAVVILTAAGAVAGIGEHDRLGGATKFGVDGGTAAHSSSGSGGTTIQVVKAGHDDHHDGCDCHSRCAHPAGSGCCSAGLPFAPTGENMICAPLDGRLGAVAPHLATGIKPEALLRPPQNLA